MLDDLAVYSKASTGPCLGISLSIFLCVPLLWLIFFPLFFFFKFTSYVLSLVYHRHTLEVSRFSAAVGPLSRADWGLSVISRTLHIQLVPCFQLPYGRPSCTPPARQGTASQTNKNNLPSHSASNKQNNNDNNKPSFPVPQHRCAHLSIEHLHTRYEATNKRENRSTKRHTHSLSLFLAFSPHHQQWAPPASSTRLATPSAKAAAPPVTTRRPAPAATRSAAHTPPRPRDRALETGPATGNVIGIAPGLAPAPAASLAAARAAAAIAGAPAPEVRSLAWAAATTAAPASLETVRFPFLQARKLYIYTHIIIYI